MVFFTNSGAESVEAALKLSRAATGRSGLLSCLGSFHGKTLGALSVTGNRTYQRPFGPLVPDCQSIPYGDLQALEMALATRQYAAFVVEPIQGEGGMVTPPPGYLAQAQRLCRDAGTLFVADEVQTGLGRTGPMFAVEREGVEPDILTLAKSLGGGLLPLGAMISRRDLWLKAYGSYQTFASIPARSRGAVWPALRAWPRSRSSATARCWPGRGPRKAATRRPRSNRAVAPRSFGRYAATA